MVQNDSEKLSKIDIELLAWSKTAPTGKTYEFCYGYCVVNDHLPQNH